MFDSLLASSDFYDLSIKLTHAYCVTTAYFISHSNSSGYGTIECNGNETKLEECVVRKDLHLTCEFDWAVIGVCSYSKLL